MKIVGLSGVARSGKDTFCNLLIEEGLKLGFNGKRFALADKLKDKIAPFLISEFGIDPRTATGQDKELIRPLLVEFGRAKRIQTNGRFWTNLLEKEIFEHSDLDFAVVTDIRYCEYEFDEVQWIRSTGGNLLHISRKENGNFIQPPNDDERRNDPILQEFSDLTVVWETDPSLASARLCVQNLIPDILLKS
jgi:hypothetical protein